MSTDAGTPAYRTAAEMVAAGIELYPVGERAVAKVADRTTGATRSATEREAILADPGFGQHVTDHMVRADWTAAGGWGEPELVDYGNLDLDPSSMFIHYGQSIFEGLKAYRSGDGSLITFRPEANAVRFRRSAARLAMAELPEELFLGAVEALVHADGDWVARGSGEVAVPAPVRVRHRGGPRRPPGQLVHVPAHGLTSRCLLPARREAGQRLAVQGVRPGGTGGHR